MKKFLTLTIIAIIALIGLSVSVSAATAEEFLTDIADGKMSSDVELTEKVVIEKDTTLDLNGKTLTMTEKASISVQKGELTVKNGTVVAAGYAFRVEASEGKAILNIESDVKATARDCAVFIKNQGSVLNTKGNLLSTGGFATISGVGNAGEGGVTVNITGGSVTHKTMAAVYFPNTKVLNISGGIIEGATAVYHKSGKLNITGGELIGTGAKVDYKYSGNGCIETGDALVIEACNYPGGVPAVSITDGIFTSENNKAVGYYKQTEDYKLADEKFITGGEFNQDVSEYVPAGYITIETAADLGLHKVKLNTPHGTQDAINTPDGNFEMLLVSEEFDGQLDSIFEQEIEKNEALKKALLDGKLVNINVQMNKVEEEDVNEDELKAMKEAAKEGKFVKFYDITLQMIANQTEDLGTISELSNKLTFKVLVPDELVKDGRTFFMYRYHDGKVEKITGELDEENYFTFESDKFSTYALAYEDKVDEPTAGGQGTAEKEPEKDETPKTGSIDVILFASVMVAVISVAGIVTVKKYTR